jgi:hypothetical protein
MNLDMTILLNYFSRLELFHKVSEFRACINLLKKIKNVNSLINVIKDKSAARRIIRDEVFNRRNIFDLTTSEIEYIKVQIEPKFELVSPNHNSVIIDNAPKIRLKNGKYLDNWSDVLSCNVEYIHTISVNKFKTIYFKIFNIVLEKLSINENVEFIHNYIKLY